MYCRQDRMDLIFPNLKLIPVVGDRAILPRIHVWSRFPSKFQKREFIAVEIKHFKKEQD